MCYELFNYNRYANASEDWPDMQILLGSFSGNTDGAIFSQRNSGVKEEYYRPVFEPILQNESYSFVPVLLRPKSRGSIRLQSKNPYDPPIINAGYFENHMDLLTLVSAHLTSFPQFQEYICT